MNVALAFQFFGIADPMALYENTHCDLYDSRASQTFCRRRKELINAMNSRTPDGAMMVENQAWKVVEDFLTYLRLWEKHAEMNSCTFLSNSTCYGLKISLQATLEVCQYLTKVCGFKYMMTARLNQDALERFFGMMRSCCGSNDHPDSTLFIQMYRLISTYSLIKPPKGSNVSGGDTLSVLMNIKDITDTDERKAQWIAQLDTIIDRGTDTDVLSNAVAVLEEHDYYKQGTSDYVLAYISGYIARKCERFAVFHEFHQSRTCNECIATLQWPATEEIPESHKLIEIKSKGYLLHPSQQLFNLISVLERATLDTLSTQQLNINTIFQITKNVLDLSPIPLIGCSEHQDRSTHNIIHFFLTTRMHFISKQSNKNDNRENRQTQERRKAAKLSSCADDSNKENSTANGSKRKAPSTKKPSKKKKNSLVHLTSKITMASGRKRTEFLSKNNRKLEVLKQLQ